MCQVSESDLLPRGVCVQCVHTLLAWNELVECSRDADKALRTRLAQLHLIAQQVNYNTYELYKTIKSFWINTLSNYHWHYQFHYITILGPTSLCITYN